MTPSEQFRTEVTAAFSNSAKAKEILANPLGALQRAGVSTEHLTPESGQAMLAANPAVHAALKASAAGNFMAEDAPADWQCGLCKTGVYAFAVAIVAAVAATGGIGTAGAWALGQIATWFGLPLTTVQGWVPAMIAAAAKGADDVATAICRAGGQCN
jgi:hypothetical protein